MESLLDAKGDLISASAADTPALVTVGADNTLLMADAAAGAGLKWAWPVLGDNSELTISVGGAVTITSGFHAIDTNADGASDDLDTINGGVTGQLLIIHAADAARTVNVTEAGNIVLNTNPSVLDNSDDTISLIYDGAIWLQCAFANNAA